MNTQINEDYVNFETAKLLKEKGFDIPCDNYYDSSGKTPNESVYGGANIETLDYNADPFIKSGFHKFKTFSAPTQSMAMKWLREIHNKNIILDMVPLDDDCYVLWTFNVYCNKNYKIMWGTKQPKYNTYEETCEAAIKYCLTNLI